VDGVIAVVDRLGYRIDDTAAAARSGLAAGRLSQA
jgi:hypothetical protein